MSLSWCLMMVIIKTLYFCPRTDNRIDNFDSVG